MKVLFVCSGNSKAFRVSPFIQSQGDSLREKGLEIDYYLINGKGIRRYLKNVLPLRRQIIDNDYDLIHSHYSLSGWISQLTLTDVPKIVSYMGSDLHGGNISTGDNYLKGFYAKVVSRYLHNCSRSSIVKSRNLKKILSKDLNLNVVPNGVNMQKFKPMEKSEARKTLGIKIDHKYVLFLGNKLSKVKNYQLLSTAKDDVKTEFEILSPYPAPHEQVPLYLNAADVLALSSYAEGSPNVIKEAMACNTPIVSTNVGDVEWVIGDTDGCFISSFDPEEYASKLEKALEFDGKTNGRDRIKELGLDTESIAEKLIEIYREVVKN